MLKKLLACSFILMSPLAALADGLILPETVYPNGLGKYAIPGKLVTSNSVKGMEIAAFEYDPSTETHKQIENATITPKTFNTQAGKYKRFRVILPNLEVTSKKPISVCMWKDHSKTSSSSTGNTLSLSYRVCRVFAVLPRRNINLGQ